MSAYVANAYALLEAEQPWISHYDVTITQILWQYSVAFTGVESKQCFYGRML